jgi:pimeloyl-ACP methyl ester carboxylesterase
VELDWQVPAIAAFLRRLASFCRVIRFDKRGTGMSDRVSGAPTLETRMDDVQAVMDAVGSERAALFGISEGAPMSILFAATYPERTWALEGGFARERWAPDYPWGAREEEYQTEEASPQSWETPDDSAGIAQALAPSANEENKQALARMIRLSASPGAAATLSQMNREIDIRQVLPAIRIPTLVMNRTDESPAIVKGSRYLAENIAGARGNPRRRPRALHRRPRSGRR